MHYTANFSCGFLAHESQGVFGGFPGMNDERFACSSGRPYMCAKALPLPFGIAFDPVIIQARFPNGDNFGMASQIDQTLYVRLFAGLVVRVNTCGRKYIWKAFRNRQNRRKGFKIDRNTKCVRHAVCRHGSRNALQIGGQFGKIYVAVRIYKQFNFN